MLIYSLIYSYIAKLIIMMFISTIKLASVGVQVLVEGIRISVLNMAKARWY